VSAKKPLILILMPSATAVIVTLSLGRLRANPKTSNPGPRLAVVAGALITTCFGGIPFSLLLDCCMNGDITNYSYSFFSYAKVIKKWS
jgi:hypothetical protein